MSFRQLYKALGVVSLVVIVGFLGCKKLTPLEAVTMARNEVKVDLSSWTVRSTPVEAPAEEPVEGDEMIQEGSEVLEDESLAEEMPEISLDQDVILDMFVVRGKADLAGITVDIVQADAQENIKNTTLLWIDFESIPVGGSAQVTRVLEGINLDDGDGFYVEVNPTVSPERRGDYQEFAGIS